ncbi:MAG TPA: hypothetical protein VJ386_12015 [Candidatus Deferrimicrobiaceae bacterium]|nr:hypothetical protein [Candidatus Deferrimicrobiaceae bacterium]
MTESLPEGPTAEERERFEEIIVKLGGGADVEDTAITDEEAVIAIMIACNIPRTAAVGIVGILREDYEGDVVGGYPEDDEGSAG